MPEDASAQPPASSLFMGTPEFALPSLTALARSPITRIHAVITQPDRPRDRGMRRHPTPVKEAVEPLGIPVFQPDKLKPEQLEPILERLPALDFIFVVAYGKKIPKRLLEYPRFGCINLHPSLLPKYRGGAPIRRALFDGERETGVTTMYLDEGWDTGDLILQERVPIPDDMDYGELSAELARRGAELLLRTAREILAGSAPRIPQDESKATHEPLLKPGEEWLDWSRPAEEVRNRIRGLSPEPAAHTRFRDETLKVLRSSLIEASPSTEAEPGTVVESSKTAGLIVATGEGLLKLEQVQPAGKRPMSALDFRNGRRVAVGEFFGDPA